MVQLRNHGGNCCGMRHIHGFGTRHGGGGDDAANIRDLKTYLATVAEDNLNIEVILSNRQTEEHPELLREMERLGFVYTTAWTGQHGTPVHLFHRAKNRLALSTGIRSFNWTGMIAGPNLRGTLPRWNENNAARARVPVERNRGNGYLGLRVGDRVRVNSPTSRRNGREFTITRLGDNGYPNWNPVCFMEDRGTEFAIIPANLVLLEGRTHPIEINDFAHLLVPDVTRLRVLRGPAYVGEVVTYHQTPGVREGVQVPDHYFHCVEHGAGMLYFRDCEILLEEEGNVYPFPVGHRFRTGDQIPRDVAGMRLRVVAGRGQEQGQEVTVACVNGAEGYEYLLPRLVFRTDPNWRGTIRFEECELIGPPTAFNGTVPAPAPVPPEELTVYRHEEVAGEAAPARVPEPTVVLTEWFAVFQNGTERGTFDSVRALREAYPRVRNMRSRVFMSNGAFVQGEVERVQ